MIQRGFEDADGNILLPFHDRVIRPSDPDYGQGTEDQVMRNADAAFAGVADEGYNTTDAPEPDGMSSHARPRGANPTPQSNRLRPTGSMPPSARPRTSNCQSGCSKKPTKWRTATTPPASTTLSTKSRRTLTAPPISVPGW